MRDKYTDVTRIGKVSSIDAATCTAQVTFEDRDDIVTDDFPVIVPTTLKNKHYHMPDVGERVLVLFDPNAPSKGYILGSYYCDTRKPPVSNENITHVLFDDDTVIEYDREKHILNISIPQKGETSINVTTAGEIKVTSNKNMKVDAVEQIDIESKDAINVDATKNMSMSSAQSFSASSKDAMSLSSLSNVSISASEGVSMNSKESAVAVDEDGNVKIRGKIIEIIAEEKIIVTAKENIEVTCGDLILKLNGEIITQKADDAP